MPQKPHVRTELLDNFMDFSMEFRNHVERDGMLCVAELHLEKMVKELQALIVSVHGTTDIGTHIDNRGGLTPEGKRKMRELARDIAAIEEDIAQLAATITDLERDEAQVINLADYRARRMAPSIA